MGRQVRRVPKNWQHPKDDNGKFIPLHNGSNAAFKKDDDEWNEGYAKWKLGLRQHFGNETWVEIESKYKNQRYTDWSGSRPNPDDYMPDFPNEIATHWMMYEDTSEGTPISPSFETPEELAQWLSDTKASAFGGMTATYDQWLSTIKRGWAVGAVMDEKGFRSGVAM